MAVDWSGTVERLLGEGVAVIIYDRLLDVPRPGRGRPGGGGDETDGRLLRVLGQELQQCVHCR